MRGEKAQENKRALLGLFYFLALGFCGFWFSEAYASLVFIVLSKWDEAKASVGRLLPQSVRQRLTSLVRIVGRVGSVKSATLRCVTASPQSGAASGLLISKVVLL
jgi:hypothetical protein